MTEPTSFSQGGYIGRVIGIDTSDGKDFTVGVVVKVPRYPVVPFFSVTSDRGRIGRITWRNTLLPPTGLSWGEVAWDRFWPLPRFIIPREWSISWPRRIW